MSIDPGRPIVIKRVKKVSGGHHGGAWKIAYADFVTAMMAFFLLMWLLSSVNKAKLRGIAEYFSTTVQAAMFNSEGTGNRESIMDGGGMDLSRPSGDSEKKVTEVPNAHDNKAPRAIESDEAKKILQKQMQQIEKQQLQKLQKQIEKTIEVNPDLARLKSQITLIMTPEGLRIQIMDQKNRPMFASGSTEMQPYSRELMHEIGRLLNNVPNQISISGHTDASPYGGDHVGYSNWELSSDRANACRRELLVGGMQPAKVLRVQGLADAVPYDVDNVFDPANRRISITVLNTQTQQAILSGAGKGGMSLQQMQAPPAHH